MKALLFLLPFSVSALAVNPSFRSSIGFEMISYSETLNDVADRQVEPVN